MSANDGSAPPTTRTLDWASIVRKIWGDEYLKKEVVYEFSNGKKYESTDASTSGIYTPR